MKFQHVHMRDQSLTGVTLSSNATLKSSRNTCKKIKGAASLLLKIF